MLSRCLTRSTISATGEGTVSIQYPGANTPVLEEQRSTVRQTRLSPICVLDCGVCRGRAQSYPVVVDRRRNHFNAANNYCMGMWGQTQRGRLVFGGRQFSWAEIKNTNPPPPRRDRPRVKVQKIRPRGPRKHVGCSC